MKELNPLLHSQLRLAVMSILMNVEEAELSVQNDKLSAEGYIAVEKGFVGKKTRTVCRITPKGIKAFEEYVEALKTYLNLS